MCHPVHFEPHFVQTVCSLTDYGQVQLDVLGGRVSVVDPTPVDPLDLIKTEKERDICSLQPTSRYYWVRIID